MYIYIWYNISKPYFNRLRWISNEMKQKHLKLTVNIKNYSL